MKSTNCYFIVSFTSLIIYFIWARPYKKISLGVHIQTVKIQGPVVQSIISLTNLLVVKMLTAVVSTIAKSQVFLLKKCE